MPASDSETAGPGTESTLFADLGATAVPEPAPSLLPRRRRRRVLVLVPILVIVAIVAAYCGTTLFWPMDAIAPTISATTVTPVPAAPATMSWPAHGAAAVAVEGFDPARSSTTRPLSMASITKVVTTLTVLEKKPLGPLEDGPKYHFTKKDRAVYHAYLAGNESALDVPVGGTLTEHQMLEGMLIGSASNYAKRLVTDTFSSNKAFIAAADALLRRNGITGITIVDPTGFERGNKATPAALMKLGSLALKDPTVAAIVAEPSVDLPGAGHVHNTNGLISDRGVDGIKTGTLVGYDLLAGKKVQIAGTFVQMYAVSMYQRDDDTRDNVSRNLFRQLERQLKVKPSVRTGTPVGRVHTAWGETVPVLAGGNAAVIGWNGSAARVSTTFHLGDRRTEGDVVGSLTASGPLDEATVSAVLAAQIDPPSAWWRLTHPLQLWGVRQ